MKEKIKSLLKKEVNVPLPGFLKNIDIEPILKDLPNRSEIKTAVKTFSSTEKIIFFVFTSVFALTSIYLLWGFNESMMVERPIKGGEMIEGIADIPRFINPLLATGEADRDMSQLVYSGLLKPGENGTYIEDLAESYEVVDDKGLNYIFKIKEDAVWHDGNPVTSDDVIFSIQKAKDPVLRSPKRAMWEGVTVTQVDSKTVQFTLKQPFQLFLENMTMGIIPKHKWSNIDSDKFVHSELNMRAIGTGPYKVKLISKNATSGMPEYVELVPFKDFVLGEPKISKLTIKFYPNQEKLYEAYKSGDITSINAVSPKFVEDVKNKGNNIIKSNLPRILAVFFNQTESKVLANKNVRIALDTAIDKKNIIDTVLLGYGSLIDSPIPPGTFLVPDATEDTDGDVATTTEARIAKAKNILSKDGWKLNEKTGFLEKKISKTETQKLQINLSTIDFTELKSSAEMVKADWESIGVKVELKIFEKGDLDRNVIEPRKYDALFFGEIVGRDLDLFSFWHSSQRKSPGVNVSMYTNSKVDKILETLKAERDDSKKSDLIEDFKKEIIKDVPASFIYSPNFVYIVPNEIKNIQIIPPITASDRFLNIHEWYIKTEKVWKIFE